MNYEGKQKNRWRNTKAGKTEAFDGVPPDDRLIDFIPDNPSARGLFNTYLDMGKTPIEAFQLVLEEFTED